MAKTSPYRRRRPALLRNLWVYRHVVAAAAVIGLLGWFCWSNNAPVAVTLPFGLGRIDGSLGLVILLSALLGSIVTTLVLGLLLTLRKLRSRGGIADEGVGDPDFADERPPSDYASKTPEGFPGAKWAPPSDRR